MSRHVRVAVLNPVAKFILKWRIHGFIFISYHRTPQRSRTSKGKGSIGVRHCRKGEIGQMMLRTDTVETSSAVIFLRVDVDEFVYLQF